MIHTFVVHNSQPWSALGTVASSAGFAVVRTSFAGGQDVVLVVNRFKTVFAPVALVNLVVFAERASCDALDALLGSRMVNVTDLASVAQRIGIGRWSSADVTVVDTGSASAGCEAQVVVSASVHVAQRGEHLRQKLLESRTKPVAQVKQEVGLLQ